MPDFEVRISGLTSGPFDVKYNDLEEKGMSSTDVLVRVIEILGLSQPRSPRRIAAIVAAARALNKAEQRFSRAFAEVRGGIPGGGV
jgi:hypothetical protein